MFDIGFWELTVIAVVALIVVGPREFPVLARKVGLWISRGRRFVGSVKEEIDREISRAEEIQRRIAKEAEIAELHNILDDSKPTVPVTGRPPSGGAPDGAPDSPPKPPTDDGTSRST